MKNIFKIFKVLTPSQLRKCFFVFFLMIVGSVFESIGISLILPLISLMGNLDFLAQNKNIAYVASFFGITTHTELVICMTVGLIIFYLMKNFFIGLEYKIQIGYTMKLQSFFMSNLLENYLNKPYEFFLKNNPSVVQRNIHVSAFSCFQNLLIPTFQLFTEITTAIVIGLMLLLVDPFVASVLCFVMTLFLYVILKSFRKQISKQGINQTMYAEKMYKWTNQAIGAVKETKVLGKERFFLNSFKNSCSVFCLSLQSYNFISQLPRLFIETFAVICLLGLILVKLFLGEKTIDIVPLMGLLSLAAFRLMPCANRIIVTFNAIKFQLPNLELVFDEFICIKKRHLEHKTNNCKYIDKKLSFNSKLEIKDIEYAYPIEQDSNLNKERKVLNKVNFVIPKGSFVGIIGQSGAGKTTFVDVLLGLLKPTSGKIYVDGIDIQSNIRGWQSNLSYVPQSIYLIDGSIKENIALGVEKNNIDKIQINKVLEMADLLEFVDSLPKGIDTEVGDRGVRLSGGQRQRIGIARALYTQSKVLILDEATSALDNETEKSIMNTILKLKGKITIISIAHRTSTLENCDFKIRFERGNATII